MSILICMLFPNSIRYGNVILWLSVFISITPIIGNIAAILVLNSIWKTNVIYPFIYLLIDEMIDFL